MGVRILGLDPGTANTGYALIEGCLHESTPKPTLTAHWGVLQTTSEDADVRGRIDILGSLVGDLIRDLQPTHIAFEDFTEQGKFVGKTYKEMAWLTEHFRTVTMRTGLPVMLYENGTWKKETIGIIRASKLQVQHYLSRQVIGADVLKSLPKSKNHIWDSVGIAHCHFTQLHRGMKR